MALASRGGPVRGHSRRGGRARGGGGHGDPHQDGEPDIGAVSRPREFKSRILQQHTADLEIQYLIWPGVQPLAARPA